MKHVNNHSCYRFSNEESYNCIRIANRSQNIIEFQLGTNISDNKDVFSQCADSNFEKDSWITQGREFLHFYLFC